jgi:hypothetical protein
MTFLAAGPRSSYRASTDGVKRSGGRCDRIDKDVAGAQVAQRCVRRKHGEERWIDSTRLRLRLRILAGRSTDWADSVARAYRLRRRAASGRSR